MKTSRCSGVCSHLRLEHGAVQRRCSPSPRVRTKIRRSWKLPPNRASQGQASRNPRHPRYLELAPRSWKATRAKLRSKELGAPLCSFSIPARDLHPCTHVHGPVRRKKWFCGSRTVNAQQQKRVAVHGDREIGTGPDAADIELGEVGVLGSSILCPSLLRFQGELSQTTLAFWAREQLWVGGSAQAVPGVRSAMSRVGAAGLGQNLPEVW
jgi:hypothetical protein